MAGIGGRKVRRALAGVSPRRPELVVKKGEVYGKVGAGNT